MAAAVTVEEETEGVKAATTAVMAVMAVAVEWVAPRVAVASGAVEPQATVGQAAARQEVAVPLAHCCLPWRCTHQRRSQR